MKKKKYLTKEQRRGEEAFEIFKKLKENEFQARNFLAENAKYYAEIFDRQLFKDLLGSEDAEWSGFLAQVEVFHTRNEIKSLIDTYKKFTELGIDYKTICDIPIMRRVDLMKIVNKDNLEEWLSKARILIPQDWKKEIREFLGKPIEDNCSHDYQNYEICKICGERHKI